MAMSSDSLPGAILTSNNINVNNNISMITSIMGNSTELFGNATTTVDPLNSTGPVIFDRWMLSKRPEATIVPILFGIIFIVGLVGNGTLIVSVLANKVMRNVPNILIVSLSLGDFLLILVSVPFSSIVYTFINWPFGMLLCKVNEYIQSLSLGVSVFTLTALSADRYVAIVDPMAKLAGRTQRMTIGVAVGIWVVAAMLAIPDLYFYTYISGTQGNRKYAYCHLPEMPSKSDKYYIGIRFVIFFLLPVIIIGFFYTMMARMLIQSSDSVPTESKAGAANHHRQIAARKKVARVVLSFVLIFIVCWLPRYIYLLWFYFAPGAFTHFWYNFKTASFCMMFINSCVNPFALYFLSGQFRKCFNRYLFCCCRRVRYSSLDHTSTMHNMHSTTRRTSPTNMSMVHSQSMC